MSKSQTNEYREDLENNMGLFITDFLEGQRIPPALSLLHRVSSTSSVGLVLLSHHPFPNVPLSSDLPCCVQPPQEVESGLNVLFPLGKQLSGILVNKIFHSIIQIMKIT